MSIKAFKKPPQHSEIIGLSHLSRLLHFAKASVFSLSVALVSSCGGNFNSDGSEDSLDSTNSAESAGSIEQNNSAQNRTFTITAAVDTVLKSSTESSHELSSEKKCQVDKGTALIVSSVSSEDLHVYVQLSTGFSLKDCDLRSGYLFADHLDGVPQNASSREMSAASNAVLSVIGFAEGTGDRYNLIFSFRTFSSFADHPRTVICSKGLCSNAAGRYQFLSTSWDETRQAAALKDFSPSSQDKGAIYRLQTYRGVRNHATRLERAAFERMIYKLNTEWASFPGSPYGQPTKSMESLWQHYQANF